MSGWPPSAWRGRVGRCCRGRPVPRSSRRPSTHRGRRTRGGLAASATSAASSPSSGSSVSGSGLPKVEVVQIEQSAQLGDGERRSSTRRSTRTSLPPPYPPPGVTTRSAALCRPRRSPPAASPASSARSRRRDRESSPADARQASCIAATTSGPVRMLPWMATSVSLTSPAQEWQRTPVHVAACPLASTMPACRCSRPSSASINASSVS